MIGVEIVAAEPSQTANDLVTEIGMSILSHEEYQDGWESLALVGDFVDGRKSLYGYVYTGDDWQARLPGGFTTLKLMRKLRDEMAANEPEPWQRCLIRIKREGLKFDIQFEYDDATRWSVSPATVERDALALKPD